MHLNLKKKKSISCNYLSRHRLNTSEKVYIDKKKKDIIIKPTAFSLCSESTVHLDPKSKTLIVNYYIDKRF